MVLRAQRVCACMLALCLSGGSGRGRGREERGRDAEETPDECDLLPLCGHSWARAGQVQSAGDQRKFQRNSQKYSGIVNLHFNIISDYGVWSILKSSMKTHITNTISQNKNTCKSQAFSGVLDGQNDGRNSLPGQRACLGRSAQCI